MKRIVKYFIVLTLSVFSLSGCTAVNIAKTTVNTLGEIARTIAHPQTPSHDSAAVMETYDAYMTMLFKGYTLRDFRYIEEHWEKIAMENPFSIGSPSFQAYQLLVNACDDLGKKQLQREYYKDMEGNFAGVRVLYLLKRPLQGGGFYVCVNRIYDLPFKLKDVMYFKNAQNCDPFNKDYCPDMTIKQALQRQIWQNSATVFVFNKNGRIQKVVTAYKCPPTKTELLF